MRTGTLAVPYAYGGGAVIVDLSRTGSEGLDLASIHGCQVRGLGCQLVKFMEFHFVFSIHTPNAVPSSYASALQKPFVEAVVEQLVRRSQAQFTFVHSGHSGASLPHSTAQSLRDQISAELTKWQNEVNIESFWDRVVQQVRVVTSQDLELTVSPRVWEQVVCGRNDGLDILYEPEKWAQRWGHLTHIHGILR